MSLLLSIIIVCIIYLSIGVIWDIVKIRKLEEKIEKLANKLAVLKFESEHGKNKTHWDVECICFDYRLRFTYVYKNSVRIVYLENIVKNWNNIDIFNDNCCWSIIKISRNTGASDWFKLDKTEDTITWIPEPKEYVDKNEVSQ